MKGISLFLLLLIAFASADTCGPNFYRDVGSTAYSSLATHDNCYSHDVIASETSILNLYTDLTTTVANWTYADDIYIGAGYIHMYVGLIEPDSSTLYMENATVTMSIVTNNPCLAAPELMSDFTVTCVVDSQTTLFDNCTRHCYNPLFDTRNCVVTTFRCFGLQYSNFVTTSTPRGANIYLNISIDTNSSVPAVVDYIAAYDGVSYFPMDFLVYSNPADCSERTNGTDLLQYSCQKHNVGCTAKALYRGTSLVVMNHTEPSCPLSIRVDTVKNHFQPYVGIMLTSASLSLSATRRVVGGTLTLYDEVKISNSFNLGVIQFVAQIHCENFVRAQESLGLSTYYSNNKDVGGVNDCGTDYEHSTINPNATFVNRTYEFYNDALGDPTLAEYVGFLIEKVEHHYKYNIIGELSVSVLDSVTNTVHTYIFNATGCTLNQHLPRGTCSCQTCDSGDSSDDMKYYASSILATQRPTLKRISVDYDVSNPYMNIPLTESQFIYGYNQSVAGVDAYLAGENITRDENCGIHIHVLPCSKNVQVWLKPTFHYGEEPDTFSKKRSSLTLDDFPLICTVKLKSEHNTVAVNPLTQHITIGRVYDDISGYHESAYAVRLHPFRDGQYIGPFFDANLTYRYVYGFEIDRPFESPYGGIQISCTTDYTISAGNYDIFSGESEYFCQSRDTTNTSNTTYGGVSKINIKGMEDTSSTHRNILHMLMSPQCDELTLCPVDSWFIDPIYNVVDGKSGLLYKYHNTAPAEPIHVVFSYRFSDVDFASFAYAYNRTEKLDIRPIFTFGKRSLNSYVIIRINVGPVDNSCEERRCYNFTRPARDVVADASELFGAVFFPFDASDMATYEMPFSIKNCTDEFIRDGYVISELFISLDILFEPDFDYDYNSWQSSVFMNGITILREDINASSQSLRFIPSTCQGESLPITDDLCYDSGIYAHYRNTLLTTVPDCSTNNTMRISSATDSFEHTLGFVVDFNDLCIYPNNSLNAVFISTNALVTVNSTLDLTSPSALVVRVVYECGRDYDVLYTFEYDVLTGDLNITLINVTAVNSSIVGIAILFVDVPAGTVIDLSEVVVTRSDAAVFVLGGLCSGDYQTSSCICHTCDLGGSLHYNVLALIENSEVYKNTAKKRRDSGVNVVDVAGDFPMDVILNTTDFIVPYKGLLYNQTSYTIGRQIAIDRDCGITMHAVNCTDTVQIWLRPTQDVFLFPEIIYCTFATQDTRGINTDVIIPLTEYNSISVRKIYSTTDQVQGIIEFEAVQLNATSYQFLPIYGFEFFRTAEGPYSGSYATCSLAGNRMSSHEQVNLFANKTFCLSSDSGVNATGNMPSFDDAINGTQGRILTLRFDPECPRYTMCPKDGLFYETGYYITYDMMGYGYLLPALPINYPEIRPYNLAFNFAFNNTAMTSIFASHNLYSLAATDYNMTLTLYTKDSVQFQAQFVGLNYYIYDSCNTSIPVCIPSLGPSLGTYASSFTDVTSGVEDYDYSAIPPITMGFIRETVTIQQCMSYFAARGSKFSNLVLFTNFTIRNVTNLHTPPDIRQRLVVTAMEFALTNYNGSINVRSLFRASNKCDPQRLGTKECIVAFSSSQSESESPIIRSPTPQPSMPHSQSPLPTMSPLHTESDAPTVFPSLPPTFAPDTPQPSKSRTPNHVSGSPVHPSSSPIHPSRSPIHPSQSPVHQTPTPVPQTLTKSESPSLSHSESQPVVSQIPTIEICCVRNVNLTNFTTSSTCGNVTYYYNTTEHKQCNPSSSPLTLLAGGSYQLRDHVVYGGDNIAWGQFKELGFRMGNLLLSFSAPESFVKMDYTPGQGVIRISGRARAYFIDRFGCYNDSMSYPLDQRFYIVDISIRNGIMSVPNLVRLPYGAGGVALSISQTSVNTGVVYPEAYPSANVTFALSDIGSSFLQTTMGSLLSIIDPVQLLVVSNTLTADAFQGWKGMASVVTDCSTPVSDPYAMNLQTQMCALYDPSSPNGTGWMMFAVEALCNNDCTPAPTPGLCADEEPTNSQSSTPVSIPLPVNITSNVSSAPPVCVPIDSFGVGDVPLYEVDFSNAGVVCGRMVESTFPPMIQGDDAISYKSTNITQNIEDYGLFLDYYVLYNSSIVRGGSHFTRFNIYTVVGRVALYVKIRWFYEGVVAIPLNFVTKVKVGDDEAITCGQVGQLVVACRIEFPSYNLPLYIGYATSPHYVLPANVQLRGLNIQNVISSPYDRHLCVIRPNITYGNYADGACRDGGGSKFAGGTGSYNQHTVVTGNDIIFYAGK